MEMREDGAEEMGLGDLDLDELEKAVQDLEKWVIPSNLVVLLKEEIIKTKKTISLEVGT